MQLARGGYLRAPPSMATCSRLDVGALGPLPRADRQGPESAEAPGDYVEELRRGLPVDRR